MRNLMYFLAGIMLLAMACRKPVKTPNPPALEHRSLNDKNVSYLKPYGFSIDGDATHDVYFTVGLVYDAEGTHAKFVVVSEGSSKLLSKPDSVLKLEKGEIIPIIPPHPKEWNGFVSYLCEILLPAGNPQDTTWRGSWVAASRKYVGVQFMKDNEPYLGWVSLSVDTARDCMVLHECAWRKASIGPIHAGNKE